VRDPLEALLDALHATGPGRLVRGALARSRLLHAAAGALADTRASAALVPRAARAWGIDLGEAEVPEGGFPSFNAFFARALRPGARPVDPDPAALVSPADGHASARAPLGPDDRLPVKGVPATVAELLADPALAREYQGGAALLFRLFLPDCHRTCFPCDGTPGIARRIPGAHHAMTPRPGNDVPWLARNARAVTLLEAPRFGRLALVDVGGFLVGSIRLLAPAGLAAAKGAERAAFALGGSAVVLLAPPGRLRVREDLLAAGDAGAEVPVRVGEAVGWARARVRG
jgi:phosphatidylserine decarboxylase